MPLDNGMAEPYQVWLAFRELMGPRLVAESGGNRYSIEVNYRTSFEEVLDHFVKLALGYIMAALKQHGYHVKHVYSVKPFRILVSTRQWEDREWVGVVNFDYEARCFVFHKGWYDKMRQTAHIAKEGATSRLNGQSASDVVRDLRGKMDALKSEPLRDGEAMNPVRGKRGPKK